MTSIAPRIEMTATEEWRRNWTVVVAAGTGFAFLAIMSNVSGLFVGPLTQTFGWSRTTLSIGLAISSMLSIALAPVAGWAIDRWGTRRIALPGIVLTALAIMGFSLANGSIAQWIGLWVLWGFCTLTIQTPLWSKAVVGVFKAGRGLALGFAMSGTAAMQVVAPPLTNWLITSFGWRAAFLALGSGWGILTFVIVFFFLHDPRDTSGRKRSVEEAAVDRAAIPGLTMQQAARSSTLWRIGLSTLLTLTITIAVSFHQFQILVEAGVTRDYAAWLVSLAGIAGIAGKMVTGALLDRFHARWVGGMTLASTAIAYPLLVNSFHSLVLVLLGMMISGYAAGTKIQLCGYLTARYSGMRNYGTISGFMTVAIALAATIGPVLAGNVHDRFGGYGPFLMAGVAVSLISALLIFSLGRYPEWKTVDGAQV